MPGGKIKYTREMLQKAASVSESYKGVLRELGVLNYSGSMGTHIKKRLLELEIDTSHFKGLGSNQGKRPVNRKTAKDILKDGYTARAKAHHLRRALLESGVPHTCAKCELGAEWQGQDLVLPVDHIDGDWSNNNLDNLRFLCPNCHSQTETFGRRNTFGR